MNTLVSCPIRSSDGTKGEKNVWCVIAAPLYFLLFSLSADASTASTDLELWTWDWASARVNDTHSYQTTPKFEAATILSLPDLPL